MDNLWITQYEYLENTLSQHTLPKDPEALLARITQGSVTPRADGEDVVEVAA